MPTRPRSTARSAPPIAALVDGVLEAHLVAICCTPAPEGRRCWTAKLLADEVVKRKFAVSIDARGRQKRTQRHLLDLHVLRPAAGLAARHLLGATHATGLGEPSLRHELGAWNIRPCREASTVYWKFTTADARLKLLRLDPQF